MDDGGHGSETPLGLARERLRAVCGPHGRTEQVGLRDAAGRVLAESLTADRAVPHYERAAMDGFAVRARDTSGAADGSPTSMTVGSEGVDASEAVQVHTGSPIPDGADAVVRVERTERRGDDLLVFDSVKPGADVAPVGEDVTADEHLFDAGRRLNPSDIALLQATGRQAVPVFERPSVCVLPTGEELVSQGVEPGSGEVIETNGLLVTQLVERWGGRPIYRDIVPDDRGTIETAIREAVDQDIVVTTGGSSVGERDLLPDIAADLGEVPVHGVAIKPGHPVGFGSVEETPVLLLPGYPVSCLINAVQFLRPAIGWLTATETPPHPSVCGTLGTEIPSAPGERTFARVRLVEAGDQPSVEPVRTSGAGVLSSVTHADGWVVVPEDRAAIPEGETVSVELWQA
jgi:molybdopterin molybdotransferase